MAIILYESDDSCPNCNSNNVDFGEYTVCDMYLFYDASCPDCGWFGSQDFCLTFNNWSDNMDWKPNDNKTK